MTKYSPLSPEESHWLLSIATEPMLEKAVTERVPAKVERSLVFKGLVEWRQGFLDVEVLAVTARGASRSRALR